MRIYSNVNLNSNTVSSFTANNMVVGSTGLTGTDGAIKYDTSNHTLQYYSTEQINGSDKGWTAIGSSESTTVNNYVDGILKIKKGTNATGNNFNAAVSSNSNNATNLTFGLDTGENGKAGNLTVSDNEDPSDRIVIDLLTNLSSQYQSAIIPNVIKSGTFEITNSHTNMPITVNIRHDLGTANLIISLYKQETGSPNNVWSSVLCDYTISTISTYNIILSLTSGSISDIRGTYMFVIVGCPDNSTISASSITVTQNNA